jgi:hypothetical protein
MWVDPDGLRIGSTVLDTELTDVVRWLGDSVSRLFRRG